MSEGQIDAAGGANVLLVGESSDRARRCCDALLDVGSADDRAELTVSFPEDVTDRTRFETGSTGRQSAKRGHVTVGDVLRSAGHSAPEFEEPVATDIVEDPTDLKAIGTSVSRFCEVWSDGGHRMVLCFDSLSDLLADSEPKVVFQFLHTLLERLSSVDTVAHFHVDPDRVDRQTLSTFGALFDEVIDPEEADDLLDESGLDDEREAESESEPSISDGIPATSGSSQASDGDVAARLDEHGEEFEVADGGSTDRSATRQASDDDIAGRIPEVDETPGDEDVATGDGESDATDAEDEGSEDEDAGDEDAGDEGGQDAANGEDIDFDLS